MKIEDYKCLFSNVLNCENSINKRKRSYLGGSGRRIRRREGAQARRKESTLKSKRERRGAP